MDVHYTWIACIVCSVLISHLVSSVIVLLFYLPPGIACPALTQPNHGSFRQSGFFLGSHVTFECHTGYVLQGRGRLTCVKDRDRGVWNYPAPTCEGEIGIRRTLLILMAASNTTISNYDNSSTNSITSGNIIFTCIYFHLIRRVGIVGTVWSRIKGPCNICLLSAHNLSGIVYYEDLRIKMFTF